ncbi:MAG: riboflavin synthase [Xanthomonadales bacterium]|nr:riboflavin synthase [Gammaproteobacteria bacterium]MBT8052011.1 riboflavin synthase [Gammaproteobacteria bacterium]MBT8055388.1 riboflavin synthase [Gammaproteobacteria bacterium]NNJ80257.1 riboflavin synthase [Xanthomonadales bacterium]NNL04711.1 riboflavin synthase [Xanthomonadales bacterium]
MFTGIVETTGTLVSKTEVGGDCRLVIETRSLSLDGCRTGDSISVSGACLTMLEPEKQRFTADVSKETLALTIIGGLNEGDPVNLELAMGVDDRMGGHLVTGHVDGLARLISRYEDGRAERFEFEVPTDLARYVARKGSVCLDGVSLTVNEVAGKRFSVCLIPHTMDITTLGRLQPGDLVNLEVDLIARYLERLMIPDFSDEDQRTA